MNTKRKQLGARLLVCGSLLGSIVLIGLYHPNSGSNSLSATSSTDLLTKAGYFTGPTRQISLEQLERKSHPVAADWQTTVPALQKKVTLHIADANIGSAITVLAKMTGLSFVCVDAGGQSRLSLQLTNVPVWQVMQALADSCGGSWQRDHNLFSLRLRNVAEAHASTTVPNKFPIKAAVPA